MDLAKTCLVISQCLSTPAMLTRRNHCKQHETTMRAILVLFPSYYCIPNPHTEWQTRFELPKPAPCFRGAPVERGMFQWITFYWTPSQVNDCLSAHEAMTLWCSLLFSAFLWFILLIFSGHEKHVVEILFHECYSTRPKA